MKKLITICLSLLITNSIFAQKAIEMKSSESDNVVSKGKNTINLYYGYSVFGSVSNSAFGSTAIGLTTTNFGPIGIVYEHLVTDKLGLGVEFGYAKSSVKYSITDIDPNTGNDATYSASYSRTLLRIQARFNYHFIQSEKFDGYMLINAGYRGATNTFSTTDPNSSYSITLPNFVPVGIKVGVGFRYFFTKAIGINAEIALGTPIMSGGLSFKF
jgi:hypothetical protein